MPSLLAMLLVWWAIGAVASATFLLMGWDLKQSAVATWL